MGSGIIKKKKNLIHFISAATLCLSKSQIFDPSSEHDLFFIFPSDIICNFPFEEMIAFQKLNNNEGTILVFDFIL